MKKFCLFFYSFLSFLSFLWATNSPPTLNLEGETPPAFVDRPFRLNLDVSDINLDPLTISIDHHPVGMELSQGNSLKWTPSTSGSYSVNVLVSDGTNSIEEKVDIVVHELTSFDPNRPYGLSLRFYESEEYFYVPIEETTSDNLLFFQVASIPPFRQYFSKIYVKQGSIPSESDHDFEMDSVNYKFSAYSDNTIPKLASGNYYFKFSRSLKDPSVIFRFDSDLLGPNYNQSLLPPIFKTHQVQSVLKDKDINLELKAIDFDNNNLTYSIDNEPDGMTLTGNTLTWVPTSYGEYTVDISVTDGLNTTTKEFTFSVPEIIPFPIGSTLSIRNPSTPFSHKTVYQVEVNEFSSGNRLHIRNISPFPSTGVFSRFNNLPSSQQYDISSSFSYEHIVFSSQSNPPLSAGNYYFTVERTNGISTARADVSVNLIGPNTAPEFDSPGDHNIRLNQNLDITLEAFDLENDDLNFSVIGGIDGAKISGSSLIWSGNEVGVYTSNVIVSDLELEDSITFEIHVTPNINIEASNNINLISSEQEEFGRAFKVHKDKMIVGAPRSNSSDGSAYIFEKVGSKWVLEAELVPSKSPSFHQFGKSVCLNDNFAFIGTESSDDEIYVFQNINNSWVETQILTDPGNFLFDNYGDSMITSGNLFITSGIDTDSTAKVFIYELYSGNIWNRHTILDLNDPGISNSSKISLDYSDNILLVASDHSSSSGVVHIYGLEQNRWNKLNSITTEGFSLFTDHNEYIDLHKNQFLLGTNRGHGILNYSGSASLYEISGNLVELVQKFSASDGNRYDEFGSSVALSDNIIAIGAEENDNEELNNNGAVYIFRKTNNTWTQTRKIISTRPGHDYYGASLQFISPNQLAIGSPDSFDDSFIDIIDLEFPYPRMTQINDLQASVASPLTIDLNHTSNGIQYLEYQLTESPQDMILSGNQLLWTPTNSGSFSVNVGITNGVISDHAQFNINVSQPSLINQIVLDKSEVGVMGNITITSPEESDLQPYELSYTWYLNGNLLAGMNSRTIELKELENLSKGDQLYTTITPSLNQIQLSPTASNYIDIVNTTPTGGNLSLIVSQSQPSLKAIVSDVTDADGDELFYKYFWTKNGTRLPSLTSNEAPLLNSKDGDLWEVNVVITDESGLGQTLSASQTISRFSSYITDISLSGNTGFYNTNFVITPMASNPKLVRQYLYDFNLDGITDATSSTASLTKTFIKGTYSISVATIDFSDKRSAFKTLKDTFIVVQNSPPKVKAGADRSGGLNDVIRSIARASDPDVHDILSYQWNLISTQDNLQLLSSNTRILSASSNTEGHYEVSVTVSDGNTQVSDNISIYIEDLFAEPDTKTPVDSDKINTLETITVSDESDVTRHLNDSFTVSKQDLSPSQRATALNALNLIFNVSETVTIDQAQLSQTLGALDNLIDEESEDSNQRLTQSEVDHVAAVIKKIFERNENLDREQVSKSFEILSEVTAQQIKSSSNQQALSEEVEQTIGASLLNSYTNTFMSLSTGEKAEHDQNHIRLRAQAYQTFLEEVEVGDNLNGYSIRLPQNFSNTPLTISVAQMTINPHKGKVPNGMKEPISDIYSFNITKVGEDTDFQFSSNITLTIPLPGFILSNGNVLVPRFFDEDKLIWSEEGISEVSINNSDNTMVFKVNHLTDFGIVETAPETTDTTFNLSGGGGGGCLLK